MFKLADTVVDAAIFREVGISLLYECIYNLAHIFYELRYRLYVICGLDSELPTVYEELFCVVLRKLSEALARCLTIADSLIIDIGDIHGRLDSCLLYTSRHLFLYPETDMST